MPKRSWRFVSPLLAFVLMLTLLSGRPESSTQPGPPARGVTVHEWGTFTSIAGRDGRPVEWRPLVGPSDLPSFVYDLGGAQENQGFRHGYQCFKCQEATVLMETPVLYFYAARPTTLSVTVGFVNGHITEWYPQARAAGGQPRSYVDWGRITVMPGATDSLPGDWKASHYYAARDTDAALVRVCGRQETQHEKFLFYRGVGSFDLPLNVKLEGDQLTVTNAGRNAVASLIVFENRGGQVGYRAGELRDGELRVEQTRQY